MQDLQTGDRIGIGIVPAESRHTDTQSFFQSVVPGQIAQRVRRKPGVDRPGKLESVNPRAEAVKRKRSKKTFFRGRPMRDHPAPAQQALDPVPKLRERRSPLQLGGTNAMDFTRPPGHRGIAGNKGIQTPGNPAARCESDSDLDREIRSAGPEPGALKVQGGKINFTNRWHQTSNESQTSAVEKNSDSALCPSGFPRIRRLSNK